MRLAWSAWPACDRNPNAAHRPWPILSVAALRGARQRSAHAADHHRLQELARPWPGPGPRPARALGAGGGRAAVPGAAAGLRRAQGADPPRDPAIRPAPDLRGRRTGAVRIRCHRPAPGRAPWRSAAAAPGRAQPGDRLDVRRAEHGGAIGVELSLASTLDRGKPWLADRMAALEAQ